MRQGFLYLVSLFFLSLVTNAQNARLSQIGSSPMLFNPALSGRFDGQLKATTQFSWQKSEMAYLAHQSISVDIKLGKYRTIGDEAASQIDTSKVHNQSVKRSETNVNDSLSRFSNNEPRGNWSLGFNYYHYGSDFTNIYDNTSPLKASFYSVNIARHFYLKKNQYAGVGLQSTYAAGKLDESIGTLYDREISGGGFRYSNKNAQNRVGKNDYIDFNVGGYYGIVTDQIGVELGIAMYHLFYPKNDIFQKDVETKLRHRMTMHSVVRLRLSPKWGILQRNMYWAEGLYWKSTSFYDSAHILAFWAGAELYKTDPKSNFNLSVGFYTRSFRTLMPLININLGKYVSMRYTYEFPVNSDKFNAYTAERTEVSFFFKTKRNSSSGAQFDKKFNYW